MKNKKNRKGTVFITAGLLLIAAVFCLVGHSIYEEMNAAELTSRVTDILTKKIPETHTETDAAGNSQTTDETPPPYLGGITDETEIPDYVLNPEMEMPAVDIDGNDYIGILRIPDLGLELPVIKEWSYTSLNIAPSRYRGSVYTDDMVIAAHNYRCHFASLQSLEAGSEVTFTDTDGNIFIYRVVLSETLEPSAVEEMTSGEFDLTLFTCNDAGYARVTVRCDKVS